MPTITTQAKPIHSQQRLWSTPTIDHQPMAKSEKHKLPDYAMACIRAESKNRVPSNGVTVGGDNGDNNSSHFSAPFDAFDAGLTRNFAGPVGCQCSIKYLFCRIHWKGGGGGKGKPGDLKLTDQRRDLTGSLPTSVQGSQRSSKVPVPNHGPTTRNGDKAHVENHNGVNGNQKFMPNSHLIKLGSRRQSPYRHSHVGSRNQLNQLQDEIMGSAPSSGVSPGHHSRSTKLDHNSNSLTSNANSTSNSHPVLGTRGINDVGQKLASNLKNGLRAVGVGWKSGSEQQNGVNCENGHLMRNGHGTNGTSGSSGGRETTFGATMSSGVTSKVLGVMEDDNLTEHSIELPTSHPLPHNLPSTSKHRHNGLIHPASQRASIGAVPSRNGTGYMNNVRLSPKTGVYNGQTNGHTNGPGPSPLLHTTPPAQNGSGPGIGNGLGTSLSSGNRQSVTSQRSSLSSLQPNSASPQQRSSPKRISPNGIPLQNGTANVPTLNGSSPTYTKPTNGPGSAGSGFAPSGGADEGLVVIRLRPDAQGRFGFNVKGGVDQNYPIIVSRVAPGSPADTCYPRLNEGDQVLLINGREITEHTHDQVVRFIRSARESHSGELMLTVRPNVYVGEDIEEPDFQYVPETPHVAASIPRSDKLNQSLLLLRDSLASGACIVQFDQLYRKKPGMNMNISKASENLNKNRYRDVLPYDSSRVIIQNGASGDYINANFVNMEIPSSGIINRYIAAQGPLPHTTSDFWCVVWEQLCTTVVMLTATVERGRIKCHQYWPRLYETQDFGQLQVTCLREKETQSTAFREFSIVNKETKEERQVSQMQYIAWPDHGVPDDPHEFIQFVGEIRKLREGGVEPLLVHCSAGIGRTGVLILMETAMCLIEANEPVYSLDVVRMMRDQRPMLIQTSSQYKFVCEAILKAYHEEIVKPMAEYQHR